MTTGGQYRVGEMGSTRSRAWRPGDLRHLGGSAESCCLPALTRFTGSDRTGPDRHTPERVPGNDTLGARIPAPAGSRRDARADDSARLERVCGFTVTVGSNPTPSADLPPVWLRCGVGAASQIAPSPPGCRVGAWPTPPSTAGIDRGGSPRCGVRNTWWQPCRMRWPGSECCMPIC